MEIKSRKLVAHFGYTIYLNVPQFFFLYIYVYMSCQSNTIMYTNIQMKKWQIQSNITGYFIHKEPLGLEIALFEKVT